MFMIQYYTVDFTRGAHRSVEYSWHLVALHLRVDADLIEARQRELRCCCFDQARVAFECGNKRMLGEALQKIRSAASTRNLAQLQRPGRESAEEARCIVIGKRLDIDDLLGPSLQRACNGVRSCEQCADSWEAQEHVEEVSEW